MVKLGRLARRPRKKKYIPGQRFLAQKLTRARSYDLEELEPRYLLSANLYDPGDGGTTSGGEASVATNIQTDVVSAFDQLAQLGNILNSDSDVEDKVAEHALPFFNKSVNDMLGLAVDDLDFGDFLTGNLTGTSSGYSSVVTTYFAGDSTPTADGLAGALDTYVQSTFGSGSSVTDSISSDILTLSFSIDLAEIQNVPLILGDEAQEFYLEFADDAFVNFDFDAVTFSLNIDTSGMDLTTATATDNSGTDSNYFFEFNGTANDTFTLSGSSAHTSNVATDPVLNGWGVGVGILQPLETAGGAGAKVQAGTFEYDFQLDVTLDSALSDGNKVTLAEMKNVTNWGDEFTLITPSGSGVNEASLFVPIVVDNPAGDQFISGIQDVTGSFTFTEDSIFDERVPLVQVSDPTLAAFSRLNPEDLLRYVEGASQLIGQTENLEEMQAFLPFLDLTLGEAYGIDGSAYDAFYDPLRTISNTLVAVNAPARYSAGTPNPLDYTGSVAFTVYSFTGGAQTTRNVSFTSTATKFNDPSDTANSLIHQINTQLAADGVTNITARSTGTNSPRIELVAAEGTVFFLSAITGTLDLGFEKNALVYARNGGTISNPAAGADFKYQYDGVQIKSTSGIDLSSWETATSFTVQVGSKTAVTVNIPAVTLNSVGELADYIQEALSQTVLETVNGEDVYLYDVINNTGVRVQSVAAGNGFGLEFTHTDGTTSLTLGGTATSRFNLGSTTGTTLTSTSQVVVSPFNTDGSGLTYSMTVKTQQDGTLSSETIEFTLPAQNYITFDGLQQALSDAMANAGLTDFFGLTGVLVELVPITGTQDVGIMFYGAPEVYEIKLDQVTAGGFAALGLAGTTLTSTAPSIVLRVTRGTGTSAVTTDNTVYLNGNASQEFFSQDANSSVNDLVDDIQDALDRAGLRDIASTEGVDFRAIGSGDNLTDTIEFFALNPGSGDTDISAIATTTVTGSSLTHLDLASKASQSLVPSVQVSRPNFDSVQTFVEQLNQAQGVPLVEVDVISVGGGEGLRLSGWSDLVLTGISATGTVATNAAWLDIDDSSVAGQISSSSAISAADLSKFTTDRSFSLTVNGDTRTVTIPGATYSTLAELAQALEVAIREAGFYRGLLESSAVYNGGDAANGLSPYLDFPVRFFYDEHSSNEGGLADLTDVELRFDSEYGSTATGRVSNMSSESVQTVSRSNDITLVLSVDLIQPEASGGTLETLMPVSTVGWDGTITDDFVIQVTLDDGTAVTLTVTSADVTASSASGVAAFVDALNTKIAASSLTGKVVAGFARDAQGTDTVTTDDRISLKLTTVGGMATRMVVEVPTGTNSASSELGFASKYLPANESLVAELPVLTQNWDGLIEFPARLDIILDDGVRRTLNVAAQDLIDRQAQPNPALGTQDFVDVLNQKLAATSYGTGTLDDILLFELDTVNSNERDVIRLIAAPGSTRSLVVEVPEFAVDVQQEVNDAADKLGFQTNLGPTESRTEYTPVFQANPQSTALDITSWFTDTTPYQLSDDLGLVVIFPDGTERSFRVLASTTTTNSNWTQLATDFNNAITAAGITNLTAVGNNSSNTLTLTFGGTATVTDTWGVRGGRDLYYGTATDAIQADVIVDSTGTGATNNIGFQLETEAFFTVFLPDGTYEAFQVEAADTTDNTDIDDLILDIQEAILAKGALSDSGALAKILVTKVSDGSGGFSIQFDLNRTDFFPAGGTWSLQVGSNYESGTTNAAFFELLIPEKTAVESQFAVSGPISSQLTAESDFQLNNNLTFDLSVNGTAYRTVTVTAASTSTNTEIGDLVADINNALAATTVTLGSTSYTAADFVTAGVISSATRIQLRLNDNAPVTLNNIRIDPGSSSTNAFVSELGFPDLESRIGMRGSDPRVSSLSVKSEAWVDNGNASGEASFGFIDFSFGAADLDLLAQTTLTITGPDRLQDLARALSGYRAEYEANASNPLNINLGIGNDTYANFNISSLAFDTDSVNGTGVNNLTFLSTASITFAYQTTGGGSGARIGVAGTTFDNPGAPDLTFTDTENKHLLSRLEFEDVISSLWRVGDLLSDYMNNDPQGPFKQKLFFVESGMVDIFDFGIAFNQVIDQIYLSPPDNLQDLARTLAIGLQLDASDIAIELVTNTDSSGFDAAINIAFQLVATATATLPLFVDLSTLRGRSINAGLVEQSLLGLSSLSGNPTTPMEVEYSALSKLILDLDIELVEDGVVIEPTPVLKQPATGDFFETKYFLAGDGYTGDIPVGANRLRLNYSWLDNEGNEVVAPGDINSPVTVVAASTRPLTATYNAGGNPATLTSTVSEALTLDGVTLEVGDLVLIKNQADVSQNGVYTVTTVGSGSAAWVLTRYEPSESGVDETVTTNVAGTVSTDASGTFLTAGANGALTLNGNAMTAGDVVLLEGQTNPAENGYYTVSDAGGTDKPWILKVDDLRNNLQPLDWLKVFVGGGVSNLDKAFMTKAIPTVDVVAVETTNLVATYQDFALDSDASNDHFLPLLEASANGALSLGGVSPALGDFVLLTNQTDPDRNGVYQVTDLGGTGSRWQLVQMDIGKSTLGQASYTTGGVTTSYHLLKNPTTSDMVVTAAPAQAPVNVVELRPASVAITDSGEVALPDIYGTPAAYHDDAVNIDPDDLAVPTSIKVATIGALAATSSGNVLTASSNEILIIDGQTLALNDTVLVNHQLDGVQNGLYSVTRLGHAAQAWQLTRIANFDTTAEIASAKVAITHGTYAGQSFLQTETLTSTIGDSVVRFSRLIEPASFQINLAAPDSSVNAQGNADKSKTLAYQVTVATTGSINTDSTSGDQVATYFTDNTTKETFIEALVAGSLNDLSTKAWDPIAGTEINLIGIDGVAAFNVGDRILVKDQFRDTSVDPSTSSYQGHYQNGVYEVVEVGDDSTRWKIKRVDFADAFEADGVTPAISELIELRVSVQRGMFNFDTRWIQDNFGLTALSAGNNVNFSNRISDVYNFYNPSGVAVQSWFDITADGQAAAALPLTVVTIPKDGGETVISKDLGSLTKQEKTTIGLLGSGAIYDDLYESMPDLPTLQILVPDDTDSAAPDPFTGSGLEKFFTTSSVAVEFTSLPDLLRTVPPSDVLSLVRDWVYLGDALDLAFFTLQFGSDLATGVEVPLLGANLPRYTGFIEQFRDQLTTQVREQVRLNPLKPVNAVRNALFAALGPNGVGWLVDGDDAGTTISESDIIINVIGQSWNIDGDVASGDYALTPEGVEFENIGAAATALEVSFQLIKPMDTDATATSINTIQSGDESIGLALGTQTVVTNSNTGETQSATGGVHLRSGFEMNFGFGLDVLVSTGAGGLEQPANGFYIFNPTKNDSDSSNDRPLVKIDVEAELDGDINTQGVQTYQQSAFNSQLNLLSVRAIDGKPDYVDATDFRSGYFGTYELDLNTGSNQNRVGRNNIGASADDLRKDETLGDGTEADQLLNFTLNADADIHLLLESERDGLIPSYQTDMFYNVRYGSGYASPNLDFTDARIAGLGDATIGAKAISDATTNPTTRQLTDEEWGNISPAYRFDRDRLVANGNEGTSFVDFQNISVDVRDYLSGPLYDTLVFVDSSLEKIRPFIDFLTTPIPGTSWMAQPLLVGDLLGVKFQIFIAVINAIEKLLGQIPKTAGVNDRTTYTPRVSMSGSYTGIKLEFNTEDKLGWFKQGNQERLDLYKKARQERVDARERKELFRELPYNHYNETGDDRTRIQKFSQALQEKTTTPNKFSEKFENFRDGGFQKRAEQSRQGQIGGTSSVGDKVKDSFRKSLDEGLAQNDDRGGKKSLTPSLNGGGFQLDALRVETALNIFNGDNADLLRVSVPKLDLAFSYTRFFPLPAFPPIGITVGFGVNVFVQLSFGWDTTGFYWTTKDANATTLAASQRVPTFGFGVELSVGLALNLGLAEAGIEAFVRVSVNFFWNTPENSDKLRQDEIAWLWDQGLSLFDVEITGEVGFRIYVDLTVPIPLFGPITIRLFEQEFVATLFKINIDIDSGYIQLAQQSGDTLRLNMGRFANDRLFIDRDSRNEVFHVYRLGDNANGGEDVLVEYTGAARTYYSRYNGIKQIYGYVGTGATEIDAGDTKTLSSKIKLEEGGEIATGTVLSALTRATVSFIGGTGSTYLRAGASYNTSFGRSRLQGGTTTATLIGGATGLDFITADGNTVVQGSTGADNIVSRSGSDTLRGNGGGDVFYFEEAFGRDRIYVTGTGNSVNFGGVSLTNHAGGLAGYTVGAHNSDGTKFQFGPLVQSVKQGLDTAFFAVDPSGADSIDTWVGTDGDDIFNVFFFAPNKTVTIDGGRGTNFYNVFLGDPKRVYIKDPTRNQGHVNINDSEGTESRLLLTQTFADTISYSSTSVTNGRERMVLTGIEQIDLDAGDSTVIWGAGDDSDPNTYEQIVGGSITTGRIIIAGNVQLTGTQDISLNLKRTLDVAYNLVVANADSPNGRDISITITNPNPLLTSDFYIGANRGLYLTQGTSTAAADLGNGYGTITILAPTGSITNAPASTGGVLQATNGYIELTARDSIGAVGNPLLVRSARITAETIGDTNFSGLQGIYLTSDQDINIRKNATSSGLKTFDGNIHVEVQNDVNAAAKVTYGDIEAGSGGDITILADNIELAGAYTVNSTGTTLQTVSIPIINYDVVYKFIPVEFKYPVFGFTFTYTIWVFAPVLVPTVSYVTEQRQVTQTLTENVAGGVGSIKGTGSLILGNKTEDYGIAVGNGTATAGKLSITKAMLDSIQDGFANIFIGNAYNDTVHTGVLDAYNYAYKDPITFRAGTINAGLPTGGGVTDPGKLSSTDALNFDAYDHDTADSTYVGALNFQSSGSYEGLSIVAKSDSNLTAQGTFTSTATSDGLLQFQAGQNTNVGDVALNGTFVTQTTGTTGSDLRAITGSTSGNISISNAATFTIDDLVSLVANNGVITQGTGGRITVDNLEVIALGSITIRTRIANLINAEIKGTGNLVIDEYDGLNLTQAKTADGTITLDIGTATGAGGTGNLVLTDPDSTTGKLVNINAGTKDVTINSAGSVSKGAIGPGEFNVRGAKLSVTAAGAVDLVTEIDTLNAATNSGIAAAANITISNTGTTTETFLLESVVTQNGAISITNSHDMQADLVQTNALTAAEINTNTITLNTLLAQGGDIIVGDIKTRGDSDVTAGGHADVTLNADNHIVKKSTGTSMITSRDVFLTASGAETTGVTNVIDAFVRSRELTATTGKAGDINIESDENLTIKAVERSGGTGILGDLFVKVTNTTADPNLSIERINTGSNNAYLEVDGTISDLDVETSTKIFGNELHVLAGGTTALDTSVSALYAYIGGNGSLTVQETNSVDLVDVRTNNGAIDITVGIDDADTTDTTVATSGSARVGFLQAGSAGDQNLTINAIGGNIVALTTTPTGYSDTGTLGPKSPSPLADPFRTYTAFKSLIDAGLFTANTWTGVGLSATALMTEVTSLTANTRQPGSLNIVETDGIELTTLEILDGGITVDAGGNIVYNTINSSGTGVLVDLDSMGSITAKDTVSKITAANLDVRADSQVLLRTNIDKLNAEISRLTGTGNTTLTVIEDNSLEIGVVESTFATMDFTVGGDLNVETLDATQSFDITLDVEGEITKKNPDGTPDYNVRAKKLTIDSLYGIDLVTRVLDFDVETEALYTPPASDYTTNTVSVASTDPVGTQVTTTTVDSFTKSVETKVTVVTDGTTKTTTTEVTTTPVLRSNNIQINNLNATTITKLHTFDGSINWTNDGNVTYDSIQGGTGALFDDTLTFDINNGFFQRLTEDLSLIKAFRLVADVSGLIDIETELKELDVSTDAAGTVQIDEVDDLKIDDITVFNGATQLEIGTLLELINGDITGTLDLDTGTTADINILKVSAAADLDIGTSLIDLKNGDFNNDLNLDVATLGAGDALITLLDVAGNANLGFGDKLTLTTGAFHGNLTLETDRTYTGHAKDGIGDAIINSITADDTAGTSTLTIGEDLDLTMGTFNGILNATTQKSAVIQTKITVDGSADIEVGTALTNLEDGDFNSTLNLDVGTLGAGDALIKLIDVVGAANLGFADKLTLTTGSFHDDLTLETDRGYTGNTKDGFGDAVITTITADNATKTSTLTIGEDLDLTTGTFNGILNATTQKSAVIRTKITVDGAADIEVGTALTNLEDGDFNSTLDLDVGTLGAGDTLIKLIDVVGAANLGFADKLTLNTGSFHDDLTLETDRNYAGHAKDGIGDAVITTISATNAGKASTLTIGEDLDLTTGTFNGTLNATTQKSAIFRTKLTVDGAADIEIGTALTELKDGDFNGKLDLDVGTLGAGDALITQIDVAGVANLGFADKLTLVNGAFHDDLTLETDRNYAGNAKDGVGDAVITTISATNAGKASTLTIGEDLDLTTGTFNGILTATTQKSAEIKTKITVGGNADIKVGTALTEMKEGDFNGTLDLDVSNLGAGDALITLIDVAGATNIRTGDKFTLTDGTFHNILNLTSDFGFAGNAANNVGDIVLTKIDVTGAAVIKSGEDQLITDGTFRSTLDSDAVKTTTFTKVNVLDDAFVDAGGDILLTFFDVDGGSADIDSEKGSVTITTVQVDSANEKVEVDAGANITLDTLTLDGATGEAVLTAGTEPGDNGFIRQTTGKTTADDVLANADTGIELITNINFLRSFINGAAGDILIDEDNSITLKEINTPSGEFNLEVGKDGTDSRIEVDAATALPTPHVTATDMVLFSQKGIATTTGFLNAAVSTITADATVDGGIYINNLLDVNLKKILANDGPIRITGDKTITATDVQTNVDTSVNSITIDTKTSKGGNIFVDLIRAGANGAPGTSTPPDNANVFLRSGGSLNAVSPNPAIAAKRSNVYGNRIVLDATSGIGNIEQLILSMKNFSISTVSGDISLANRSTKDTTITNMTTGSGNITFNQSGGGDLTVQNVGTGQGDIFITVADSATLNVFKSVSKGGDTTFRADEMEFLGGANSIKGDGDLTITPFSNGINVDIYSNVGGTPFEVPQTLELAQRDVDAIDQGFSKIFIGALEGGVTTRFLNYDSFDYKQGNDNTRNLLTGEEEGEESGESTELAENENQGNQQNFRYGYQPLFDLLNDRVPNSVSTNGIYEDEESPYFFQFTKTSKGLFFDEIGEYLDQAGVAEANQSQASDLQENESAKLTLAGVILLPMISGSKAIRRVRKGIKKATSLMSCFF